MEITMLKIEREFRCAAGGCEDNCCVGWEIPIDGETLEKYSSLQGQIGNEIRRSIKKDAYGTPIFCTDENGRCAHLDACGLCNIIKSSTDSAIPDICDRHPRYYNLFRNVKEGGLGLSCPAAVDIFLTTPLSELLETCVADKPRIKESELEESMFSPECEREILKLRENIFTELNSEKSLFGIVINLLNLGDEILHASDLSENYEEIFFNLSDANYGSSDFGSLLENHSFSRFAAAVSLAECITDSFEKSKHNVNKYVQIAEKYLKAADSESLDTIGRKLLFYFLHRYMIAGIADVSVGAGILFSVYASVTLFGMISAQGERGAAEIIRDFSKNLEYSEDNISGLRDSVYP